jgi:hypothetical protein
MATKAEKALLTRKAWVIQEIGWEYNDEYYYRGNSEGGTPQRVYFDHDRAMLDCAKMNAARLKHLKASGYPMEDGDGKFIKVFYEIVEVVVAD